MSAGEENSRLSTGSDSFSNLRSLTAGSTGNKKFDAERAPSTSELREVEVAYLKRIIGDYISLKVGRYDLMLDSDVIQYEKIINDPSVTITSKVTNFSTKETRDGKEFYAKDPCYIVILEYKVVDYGKALKGFSDYIEAVLTREPKVNDPGGVIALVSAWEYSGITFPASFRPEYDRVIARAGEIVAVLKKRAEEAGLDARTEIEATLERLSSKFSNSDTIPLPDGTRGIDAAEEIKTPVADQAELPAISSCPAGPAAVADAGVIFENIMKGLDADEKAAGDYWKEEEDGLDSHPSGEEENGDGRDGGQDK